MLLYLFVMKKSFLEKYSDITLWRILLILTNNEKFMKEYNEFENIWDSWDFCNMVTSLLKPLGITANEDLDFEFVMKIIELNKDKIDNKDFSGSLIRPELKLYEFDIDENSREYVATIWTHKRYAYDISTIENILRSDNFYLSEGKESYRDVYDSETTESKIEDIRTIDMPKQNENYNQQSELKKLLSERQKIDHKIRKLLK
jgi:hypothetical protein